MTRPAYDLDIRTDSQRIRDALAGATRAPFWLEDPGRPAPRPAYSVLRSEHADAPRLPHWRDGLVECLARLR